MPFWPDRFHVPTVRSGTAAAPFVPFVGALDPFPPDFAWSHRRALVSSFEGNIFQARRTSDSAPFNAARLANGEADIAGLQSFVGSGTATVASLTELMGTGCSFIQPTGDLQRVIVDAGVLVNVNGQAASRGLRTPSGPEIGGAMYTPIFDTYSGTVMTVFLRGQHDEYSGIFNSIVDGYFGFGKNGSAGDSAARTVMSHRNGTDAAAFNWLGDMSGPFVSDYLLSFIFDGTTLTLRDGSNTYTISTSTTFDINRFTFGLLVDLTSNDYCSAANRWQEAAVWLSDQSSNEAAIRSALLA